MVDRGEPEVEPQHHLEIAITRPKSFADIRIIGEYYRREIPVLIDLGELDNADAKRVIDFASGATFGKRGGIERVAKGVFLMVPPNASVLKQPEPGKRTLGPST